MQIKKYLARELKKYVDYIFCGNGGWVVNILEAIKQEGLNVIPFQNEQGASFATDSYARLTGIGVSVVTAGPGFCNCINGITGSYYDGVNTLTIVGTDSLIDFNKKTQLGFQEMNISSVINSFAEYQIISQNFSLNLDKLKKPLVLEFPDNVQRQEHQSNYMYSTAIENSVYHEIVAMSKLINESKKPVIVAGQGIKRAECLDELIDFVDNHNIDVFPTWAMVDSFPNSPRFGICGSVAGNKNIENADLIISLGSRLDTHQLGSNFEGRIISVGNRHNDLKGELRINCDLKHFFEYLQIHHIARKKTWVKKYKEPKRGYPYQFIEKLSEILKDNAIIIPDTGATLCWTMQAIKPKLGQTIFTQWNMASMGYAICASIGAYFAQPERQLIVITGDGGIHMNIQELETIKNYNIPAKIFIFNNQAYGIINQTFNNWGMEKVGSDKDSGLSFPNFKKLAYAYSIDYIDIESLNDFSSIQNTINANFPVIYNVIIDKGEKITPKLKAGQKLGDIS